MKTWRTVTHIHIREQSYFSYSKSQTLLINNLDNSYKSSYFRISKCLRKTESVLFVLFCEYLWLYIKYSKLFSILCNCLEVSWSCPWALKSLSCVIEQRKSLTCVFEQLVIWYYILVELSLEVQGGQDYFRIMEGTCINCLCSSSVSCFLTLYPLH